MDYNALLELAVELGYGLAVSGAETFRVEESITRVLQTYGITPEVFAIPNNLLVSIETEDHNPMTRMRRIGYHGNDLDSVERFSNLSRRICEVHPDPHTALQWLQQVKASRKQYRFSLRLLGSLIGASGYAVFFGGSIMDFAAACLCGMLVGFVNHFFDKKKVNLFFSTMVSSFLMAVLSYCLHNAGLGVNADHVIIGTLMILLPGLLFTNALRDIIYGDTNSGINRIVQVLLIASAVVLGTATAWNVVSTLWTAPPAAPTISHPLWLQCTAAGFGCIGFCLLFNIHGRGSVFCALGGALSWAAYGLVVQNGGTQVLAYFVAVLFATIYSESMARIRKYPAISYLLMSIFPLIPGAGIYYTASYMTQGNMGLAGSKATESFVCAGVIAVGILMVSSLFRLWSVVKQNKRHT